MHWATKDANTSDGNWTKEILNDQNLTAIFKSYLTRSTLQLLMNQGAN